MAKCDKCGRVVATINDATVLDAIAFEEPAVAFMYHARHLLPVVENGTVVCEGSPSRAQYLDGQPRDTRGYPYLPEHEARYRAAYAEMKAKYS